MEKVSHGVNLHKSCFENVCKPHRKAAVKESLFNKVSVYRPAFLIKMAVILLSKWFQI